MANQDRTIAQKEKILFFFLYRKSNLTSLIEDLCLKVRNRFFFVVRDMKCINREINIITIKLHQIIFCFCSQLWLVYITSSKIWPKMGPDSGYEIDIPHGIYINARSTNRMIWKVCFFSFEPLGRPGCDLIEACKKVSENSAAIIRRDLHLQHFHRRHFHTFSKWWVARFFPVFLSFLWFLRRRRSRHFRRAIRLLPRRRY